MLFDGAELREIIYRTPDVIELAMSMARCCRILSSAEALALDLDLFVASETGAAFDFCAGVPGTSHSTPEVIRQSA